MGKIISAILIAICPSMVQANTNEDVCLSNILYYESNMEPIKSQRAVLDVVFHRMKKAKQSCMKIVSQANQFSWHGLKHKPMKPLDKDMKKLLRDVRNHAKVLDDERFLYFFSVKIKRPRWAKKLDCVEHGSHLYCR